MTSWSPSRRERLALLFGILCVFAAAKLAFNPGLGRNSLDGDYYYQVARHVNEGDGLLTSVSLYHQGLKEFPHKTNISPVWPLTLGYVGRVFGLYPAALLLPELLYLLDLLLLYLVTNRLIAAWLGSDKRFLFQEGQVLDLGHIAVVLFGLNPIFFQFTSAPYTEALAFLILLGTFLVVDRLSYRPSLALAASAGALAGVALMTRSQMIGLVAGLLVGIALVGLRHRRYLVAAIVAAAAGGLILLPWVVFLRSFVEPFDPRVMVALGAFRETPEIDPFRFQSATQTFVTRLVDLFSGIGTALSIRSPDSYVASFGLATFLVPLAVIQWLSDARKNLGSALATASGRPLLPLVVLLTACAMLAPIHWSRFRFFREWLFGFRHGLPFVLLLIAALAYLLARSHRVVRTIVLALVLTSVFSGSFEVARLLGIRFPSGLLGPEIELVDWLDRQDPKPRVVTTNAQPLSVYSRAGFHWMECREDPRKTSQLLDLANADYVLMYAGEENCNFLSRRGSELEPVKTFGQGQFSVAVYQRRSSGLSSESGDDPGPKDVVPD